MKKITKLGFLYVRKILEEIKNFISKIIENIEETMPLKSLFDSFRYLNPLPRYESK